MEIVIDKGRGGTTPEVVLCPVGNEKQLKAYLDKYLAIEPEKKKWVLRDLVLDTEENLCVYSAGHKIIFQSIKQPLHYRNIRHAFQSFSSKNKGRIPKEIAIDMEFIESSDSHTLSAIANGFCIGQYQLGLYKTSESASNRDTCQLHFLHVRDQDMLKARLGQSMAETQKRILDIVNAPSNRKNPASIAAWVKESGEKYGYKSLIFGEEELQRVGMEALLAVNRGSEEDAKFIILEYRPEGAGELKTIGLVGKGVTFDTGGLSIKPSRNMHYMKSDLGGAAAIMGVVELAAKEKLQAHLLAFLPVTDNSVDALSIKPGAVINSYSGKTIEVIDTDAEGRLILADALAYAVQNYQLDYLIDLATLTGSVVRTFGNHCAGMFSNNDALASAIEAAATTCGERVWRLPLWDEYAEEMKSEIADIRNLSISPAAGAITAAKFLEVFTGDHTAWAHLDIAGTAFHSNSHSKQYSATAYGTALLFHLIPLLSSVSHDKTSK